MENFFIKSHNRFRDLPWDVKFLFVVSFFIAFAWIFTTRFVFTQNQNDWLSEFQIDKIVHFSGGIFIAGIFSIYSNKTQRRLLIFWTLAVGILWEIWEILFFPDQYIRYQVHFLLWLTDTLGDIAADILGAYFLANIL